ncbi:uncharacterized protein BDZ99DRAFT_520361 [Mytilinidion resinicola]|uniref:Uncharacterized protein n=1 Tax=Mytilinidion resinicola TaxID=574789 RepID=A0A6A6YQJ6_9PEZI|nr:uncharacterized protein BDZ99DRAFT_520361 [Mytilinidion resinicola]KAF2810284.1 hypothetical protein BDZ99DRAFT_520361 [Mytilinidion resinicola]
MESFYLSSRTGGGVRLPRAAVAIDALSASQAPSRGGQGVGIAALSLPWLVAGAPLVGRSLQAPERGMVAAVSRGGLDTGRHAYQMVAARHGSLLVRHRGEASAGIALAGPEGPRWSAFGPRRARFSCPFNKSDCASARLLNPIYHCGTQPRILALQPHLLAATTAAVCLIAAAR